MIKITYSSYGVKPLFVLFLSVGFLWSGRIHAQESIHSSGGDATGSGGSVAYSLGQVVYTTNDSTSGAVSQGVQQAYEIYTVGINATELNMSLTVFPNPTVNDLILQISDYNYEKLVYQLFDMQGKQLSQGHVTTQQTLLNMKGLASATYILNVVYQENKNYQSFKIIKN